MIRCIAVVICLFAALFLIPVQGECSEICEFEPETELECCIMSCNVTVSPAAEISPDHIAGITRAATDRTRPPKTVAPAGIHPARTVLCVFRE